MVGLSDEAVRDKLRRALPEDLPGVRWSVMVRDAKTGEVLAEREAGQLLRTASVGKVFLLVEAARALETGEASVTEPLSWQEEELVGDSGLWHRMAARELPFVDVCMLVGAVSDNLGTNVLVRRLGIEPTTATARSYGVTESGIRDRIRNHRGPDVPWTASEGNARELSDVMARLERGEVVSAGVSQQVATWLNGNVELSGVPAGLSFDALAHGPEDEPEWRLYNKTGSIEVVQADVGVLAHGGRALAYACLAEWEEGVDARPRVRDAMRQLGLALADTLA